MSLAQCSSCDETYSAPGTTNISLSSNNKTYCITGSGEYSGNVTLSGSNSFLCIDEDVVLTGDIEITKSNSTLNNYGTVTTNSLSFSGTVNNYGYMQINGTMTVESSGNLNNYNETYGALKINGDLFVNSGADMTVQGTVVINGDVTIDGEVNLEGAGLDIDGDLTVKGKITGDPGASGCNGIAYTGSGTLESGSKLTDLDICNTDSPADTDETGTGVSQCNCSALLPVEYVSFTATYLPYEETTKVSWITSSESQNDYFVVERSYDGYTFDEIGTVNSVATTQAEYTYNFFDKTPLSGLAYFRLKQVDKDGNSSLSKVVVVKNYTDSDFSMEVTLISENMLQISLNQPDFEGNVQVYDIIGKTLYNSSIESYTNSFDIQINNLSLGNMYVVILRSTSFSISKKIFIP
ncbi:hypothetical protein [Chondrinema litorale]|uniref:hypothetical protein n=1 Tax=Chondrinema litorale TaxID=2994555 RepID=UPI002543D5EB|nr:hypothetical protein [Chondrinema litorale]UZR98180.1 hypothetical protein OQ292_29720 [Chondrinema litorale]